MATGDDSSFLASCCQGNESRRVDALFLSNGSYGQQQPGTGSGGVVGATESLCQCLLYDNNNNNQSSNYGSNYSNDNNDDNQELPVPPFYLFVYVTLASALIFLAGVFGNLLVIFVVVRMRSMRTRMNYFLVSLSVADLMVLSVCQPVALLELYAKERWLLGPVMCKLIPFLENTAVHCSALSLLAISVERYVAICRPLLATTRHNSRVPTIVLTWGVSVVLCVPFIVMSNQEQAEYADGSLQVICRTSSNTATARLFVLLDFVLCMLLPLLAITFFYSAIVVRLASTYRCCGGARDSTSKLFLHGANAHRDDTRAASRRQVIKMMVAIVVVFYVCLLPFRCFIMYVVYGSPANLERLGFHGYLNVLHAVRLLTFANSASNPIIYGLMCFKFRMAFATVLPWRCSKVLCLGRRRASSMSAASTYHGGSASTKMHQLRRGGGKSDSGSPHSQLKKYSVSREEHDDLVVVVQGGGRGGDRGVGVGVGREEMMMLPNGVGGDNVDMAAV